ncbi:phosphatidylglycerophosphatase A [Alphaproteobacteria bacterium]|nr:phosphatidylglycerophosphatase A [Alphaproteobacteria bacterium]
MINFSKLFVSLFFVGYFPIASGTVGTLVSLILIFLFVNSFSILTITILFILVFIASIIFINIYSDAINKYDASEIVIDEFLGVLFIIIFYDYFKFTNDLNMFIIILILFRFFDILKPFPIKWIEKNIKNAWGVLFDDIFASIYCLILLFSLHAIL